MQVCPDHGDQYIVDPRYQFSMNKQAHGSVWNRAGRLQQYEMGQ
jgi:hypothetical protein